MGTFVTFRRWRIKAEASEHDVLQLVRDEIIPAYARLSSSVTLGLARVVGTNSLLATQEWDSRSARDLAVNSDSYSAWFNSYETALSRWHAILELEDEWEAESLLGPHELADH
jgi:hypothetical protein